MAMCCKKKMIKRRIVRSMKWRVSDQEIDQRKLGAEIVHKDCQACKLNMNCNRWKKQIKDD